MKKPKAEVYGPPLPPPRRKHRKTGRKPGLPPTPISVVELFGLGKIFCTVSEAAAWFRLSEAHFIERLNADNGRLRTIFAEGRSVGRISLRRRLLQQSELPGSAGVHASETLAKFELGMSETRLRREGATGDVDEKIEIIGGLPPRDAPPEPAPIKIDADEEEDD